MYPQHGYTLQQIQDQLAYYQSQLISLPNPPRTYQEQQALQACNAEIQKWTNMWHQMQAQIAQRNEVVQQYVYPQPQMQQQVMMQQPVVQYGNPIQPYGQQQATTTMNSNTTNRYSSRMPNKPVQQQATLMPQMPVTNVTNAPVVKVEDKDVEVEFYIPATVGKVAIETRNYEIASASAKSVEEYKNTLTEMVKGKFNLNIKDPFFMAVDRYLTNMFNVLAKNYSTKDISVDSFIKDYPDIIKYMDNLELVKDQKQLDRILEHVYDLVKNIEVKKVSPGELVEYSIKFNSLYIQDEDSYKDLKKTIKGKDLVVLKETFVKDVRPLLPEGDFQVVLLTIDDGVFTSDYLLVHTNSKTSVHVI